MRSGIVVGYDGSACAQEALRVAIDLGRTYGEKVTVAFAYEVSPVGGETGDYRKALNELATTRVHEALTVEHEGLELETAILERSPAPGLVELAGELDARLIVVGTHGESPLVGAVIGSTAHRLLHWADRPVVMVPARHDPEASA